VRVLCFQTGSTPSTIILTKKPFSCLSASSGSFVCYVCHTIVPPRPSCGRPCSEWGNPALAPGGSFGARAPKGGSRTPPPPGARVPHLRESSPSRRGGPRKGPKRGAACMELRRIPGAPCINPARGSGERGASRRWKGMQGKPIHPPQSSTRT
jgi:hypothetical protein